MLLGEPLVSDHKAVSERGAEESIIQRITENEIRTEIQAVAKPQIIVLGVGTQVGGKTQQG